MVGAGFAEDVEAEVAAGFGPFVVLFGSTAPTRRIRRCGREDSDDVGAPADFLVESFFYPASGRSTRRVGCSSIEALEVVGKGVATRSWRRLRRSSRGTRRRF
ncbi:hypothetical protein L843_5554 [Mycobacterium intracellulare MIN_061107_1834]|nr:hypothetical protein L843_5554 [Mycobacterium intracellulare MIN_061107_1834]